MQSHLLAFLRMRGYASVVATSVDEALDSLTHRSFRFTLLDLDLDGDDTSELVQRLRVPGGDTAPTATGPIGKEIDLWRSPKMLEVRDIINDAAGVDVTVLVTGETGT